MSEASGAFSSEEQQAGTSRVRLASPVARLGQLSVEAAKQHRLGVEADYFPKIRRYVCELALQQVPVASWSRSVARSRVVH